MVSRRLGGLLGGLGDGSLDVVPLSADPTVTATLEPQGVLGTFGGDLFVHLTAGNDTRWLNLSLLGGVMTLASDPTQNATLAPMARFGYLAANSTVYLHLTNAEDTAWINLLYVSQLAQNPTHDRLLGLANSYDAIQASVTKVLFGEISTAAVSIGKPLTLIADNDGYLFPMAGGGFALVEYQVTGGYVPTPLPPGVNIVCTLDARPWLVREAAADPEAAMSLMNEGLSVILNTVCGYNCGNWSEDDAHAARDFSWPTAGDHNRAIVQSFAHTGYSVSGFGSGADALQVFGTFFGPLLRALALLNDGSVAQMSITVAEPITGLADNQGYQLVGADGRVALVEYQRTGGYVPTPAPPGVDLVVTVDVQAAASSLDVVLAFKAACLANLFYVDAGFGPVAVDHTTGLLNWPQNTAGGNQPVDQQFVLAGWSATSFTGGTDPLRQLNRVIAPPVQYLSVPVTFDLFSGSGLTQLGVNVLRLPPGARLVGANMQASLAFQGAPIATCTLEVDGHLGSGTDTVLRPLDATDTNAYADHGSLPHGAIVEYLTVIAKVTVGVLSDLTGGAALLQVQFIEP